MAIKALALDGAIGYLTASQLLDSEYAGGLLALVFLFQLYYLGSVFEAEKSAQQAIYKNTDRWRQVMLNAFNRRLNRTAGRSGSYRQFDSAIKNTPRRS